ncbi:heterokaryon incompatibility protein-domain-containing protein [Xylariaceae sp. FL0804]|nr:heterokaryon incompatibility protein-domain-containing protein [Xylariaceae sp. FL0804]
MRLLHTTELLVQDFNGDVPPYAILSHTWGDEELSFSDMEDGRKDGRSLRSLKGWQKITQCCKQAISDGFEYVWIDTCCIDKRSSAELSEAINSMFSWYRDAVLCYAYLEDVVVDSDRSEDRSESHEAYPPGLIKSRWFTRGWTLQELIAPPILVFYSSSWSRIDTREKLQDAIVGITGISRDFFLSGKLGNFSIAQKMSWASKRNTTRVEDRAYCLLGLFGVTMPLLYGEGRRAFVRLQEEIMKESDDQSIFAWDSLKSGGGLLASVPDAFANCGSIVRCDFDEGGSPYSITNKGIQICLPILGSESDIPLDPFVPFVEQQQQQHPAYHSGVSITITPTGSLAVLNCRPSGNARQRLCIFIEKKYAADTYVRINRSSRLVLIDELDIREKAVRRQVLIQAHNASPNDEELWTRSPYKWPVIIHPFPAPWANFKFDGNLDHKGNISEAQHCLLAGGTTSLHVTTDEQVGQRMKIRPVTLCFIDPEHQILALDLWPSKHTHGNRTGVDASIENVESSASDTQRLRRGPVDFSLQIRDAEHATIISFVSSGSP